MGGLDCGTTASLSVQDKTELGHTWLGMPVPLPPRGEEVVCVCGGVNERSRFATAVARLCSIS